MQLFKSIAISCAIAVGLSGAENPFLGKWRLNAEKSTFAPGEEMKELTVSFEPHGDKVHRVSAGTYTNGKPVDEGGPEGSEFPWDGKEHTVHEVSPKVVIACTPVKNGATHVTIKTDGMLVVQMRAQVSADGQTLTETSDNTDRQGRHSKSVQIFAKQ